MFSSVSREWLLAEELSLSPKRAQKTMGVINVGRAVQNLCGESYWFFGKQQISTCPSCQQVRTFREAV